MISVLRKILWCSDNPILPTGYAQVTRNVGNRLVRAGFNFSALGFQQFSLPIEEVKTRDGWLNFPIRPATKFDEFYGNKGSLDKWIQELRPEVTLFLLDTFMLNHLIETRVRGNVLERTIDRLHQMTKLWMYFPFDSADVYSGSAEILGEMDVRIAMSKFAQALLKKETGMDSYYIPHGVDHLVFRRLPEQFRQELKRQSGLENKFVIGSVFRNQTRKMPTKLLEAFDIFAKDKKDVALLLHCDINDPQGQNLPDFISKRKLDNSKIKFTNMNFIHGLPLTNLNFVYNCMDLHTLSTTGEGFGLPIIESQACGIPNIVTDYTTSRELVGGHGMLVKLLGGEKGYVDGQANTKRALVDVDHMAQCFQKYYDNRKLMENHGKLAEKFTLENYNWDDIVRMWIDLLEAK